MSAEAGPALNPIPGDWDAINQRYLQRAMGEVRMALECHVARAADPESGRRASRDKRTPAQSQPWEVRSGFDPWEQAVPPTHTEPALAVLESLFGLSTFERSLLVLCAAVELDAHFAGLCAAAQEDPRRTQPTFSLALAALPSPHWSAVTPAGALRRWRLVEVGAGEALTTSPLRIDERVLHYLAGVSYLDERLTGLVERPESSAGAVELPPSYAEHARRIVQVWTHEISGSVAPLVELCGPVTQSERRAIAAVAAAELALEVLTIRGQDIPSLPLDREAFTRLWEREAALSGSALLVDCEPLVDGPGEHTYAVLQFLEQTRCTLLAATREPLRGLHRPIVRLDVRRPGPEEQQALWRGALGPIAEQLNGQVERLAGQFALGLGGIWAANAEALSGIQPGRAEPFGQILWDACRVQARPRLDDLAQRIEPVATWDTLILPEPQRQFLRDIAAQVRHRPTVYDRWGFGGRGARGLGVSALFAGGSGTGKTMAAEVLANELRLDLYKIDLSSIVSKYIGETEKNLRRVFDSAEEGGAILLFDEADALFGKRSEVKDSHDRYANIEVSYLLQRMESYRGLAVLTTNRKEALDHAFLRRIRFVVTFPFPDAEQRAEIWRSIFPAATPTEQLNIAQLARLNVAGGNIRNIALSAAFFAADANEPVRMKHLLRAARIEYAKLEKPLTDAEIGHWQ